jgi:hypothetical protein
MNQPSMNWPFNELYKQAASHAAALHAQLHAAQAAAKPLAAPAVNLPPNRCQKKNIPQRSFLKKNKSLAAPALNRRNCALTKTNLKNVVFLNTVLKKKKSALRALFVLRNE